MTNATYPKTDPNPNFPELEEAILKFWQEKGIFRQSVENRPERCADGSRNAYVFYDGPPFANGLPHYGHLLTGYVKDVIARYQTMRGRRVERRFGWDCHGLPAEMGAEKELGISGRAAIMDFGIDKFNAHCRTSVMKYTADWEYYVNRQGRWVDFKNDYKTMDKSFMESCLWAFKELWNKGLVYESLRVMPYSWAAETPVSNFETRIDNATRPKEDRAAYVKFRLKERPQGAPEAENYYLIAWTTTPWTLPANLGLAVNKEMDYRCYEVDGDCLIVSSNVIPAKAGIHLETGVDCEMDSRLRGNDVKGSALVGLTYEPLFPYFADTKNAFCILDGSSFVAEGDGTGIVHIAPGFGEDDFRLGQENNLEAVVPVDEKGRYTDEIFDLPDLKLRGLNVVADTRLEESDKANHISEKDVQKFGLANMRILRWLKARNLLVKDEVITHNYPHCWRTDTPLIYRAMSSWYVNVQQIKANMAANNQTINWIPGHVKDGQMGRGIESAPDWSISRNRFWGTPIPIWKSASGKIHVCGSIAEIEQLSGQKIADLHRPMIDNIVLKIDGEDYTRIEDVFDCWFESGSMPFAQVHYPFENKDWFEANFPADFITEYIAQTRGWFYTLQVLSAALFGCAPFKNVICHGVVIDEETGLKYSKRLKNYKDPKEVMDAFGADALRWMMLASPVMRGSDLAVDPEGKFIRDVVRLNIKPLWSAYNFFTLYANADGVKAQFIEKVDNRLDAYILAKCKAAVAQVRTSLDAYDTPGATEAITSFLDVLNNWYIRRARDRFWSEEISEDKKQAHDTLFTVLNAVIMTAAPLLPFVTEAIYRGLNGESGSVHLQDFPDLSGYQDQAELIETMDRIQEMCTAAHAVRSKANIRTRQPLSSLQIFGFEHSPDEYFISILRDEVNVKEVIFSNENIASVAAPRLEIFSKSVGKKYPQKMKEILAAAKQSDYDLNTEKQIEIAGVKLIQREDCRLILEPLPQYVNRAMPLPSNDGLVVLDLTITPELEAEGAARDVVRMIQQARKDAGLQVTDRIALTLDLPQSIQSALAHRDYIADQTLAVSLTEGSAASAEHRFTQEVDGETVTIGLSRAA
jgi:isoleucyl-tRNA synthetase